LRFSIEHRLVDKRNKEITMVDHKSEEQRKEEYAQWQELSKAHWSRWRAWGSWFSWGSPVGLGLFFVLLAVAFAVLKYAISL
jgi:hypothetical protein